MGQGNQERQADGLEGPRGVQEAQEVWCAHDWGGAGTLIVGVCALLLLVLPGLGLFAVVERLTGSNAIAAIVAVGAMGPLAMLLVGRLVGRVVVRMEGARLRVRQGMIWKKTLVEYAAEEMAEVRVGTAAKRAEGKGGKTVHWVVVRLVTGEHVWLVKAQSAEEAQSVGWEVADFYRLPMDRKPLAGMPVTRWWVVQDMSRGAPDYAGIEVWDSARVVEGAKKRGRVVTVTEKHCEVKARAIWTDVGFWLVCVVTALVVPLAWLLSRANVNQFWGLLLFFGFVAGLIWMIYLAGRAVRVTADASGVRVHHWFRTWRYSAENIGWVDVRYPEPMGEAGEKHLEGDRRKMFFAVKLGILDAPAWPVTLDDGFETMGEALGVARAMREAMGKENAGGDDMLTQTKAWHAGEEAAGVVGGANAALVLSRGWLMGAAFLGVLAVLAGVAWVHNTHYPVAGGSWVRVAWFSGEVAVGVLWVLVAVVVIGEKRWMELGEKALVVKSKTWLGEKTEYEVEKGKVGRAWVYRAQAYAMKADGMSTRDWVMLELNEPRGRCVLPNRFHDAWPGAVAVARKINAWLGLGSGLELVRAGALVNGVVLPRNEDGEVVAPETWPEGWEAGEIQKRSHRVEREEPVGVKLTRKLVWPGAWWWVGASCLLGGAICCLVSAVWGPNDRSVGLWGFGALALFLWWASMIQEQFLKREWTQVNAQGIQVRRMKGFKFLTQRVVTEDVEDVCATCEQKIELGGGEGFEFVVNVRTRDGGYVKVVTGILSVEEAVEIREAVRGVIRS